MNDEQIEKVLQQSKVKQYRPSGQAIISDCTLKSPVKNVIEITKIDNVIENYIILAKELAKRLCDRFGKNWEYIPFEELTKIEQKMLVFIRLESSQDKDHLKSDYVITSFDNYMRNKHGGNPPRKRLQLTDKQLERIFTLKAGRVSIREIARQLVLSRQTVTKVLKKEYDNLGDIKRIENAEKKTKYQQIGSVAKFLNKNKVYDVVQLDY